MGLQSVASNLTRPSLVVNVRAFLTLKKEPMRSSLWLVLSVAAAATAAKSPLPSFLMLLGDDIGWADFKWNNGTYITLIAALFN